MELIPYNRMLEVVRHHAFVHSTHEMDDKFEPRYACTEVVTCGGGSEFGVLMRGVDAQPHPAAVGKFRNRAVVDVATSAFSAAVVTDTGELYVAGLNDEGQLLPDETQQILSVPVLVENLNTQKIISVSCGDHHTAVINGAFVPLTYGSDEFGALGHNEDRSPPYRIPPRVMKGIGHKKVLQVACGATHTLVLTQDGGVFSCGSGVRGALGLGNREDRKEATRIPALIGIPIIQVAAGDNYSCAISSTGFAYSWGINKAGQTGLPTDKFPHAAYSPTRVSSLPELTSLVSCGESHTMWLSYSGRLYASGKNSHGQLALGVTEGSPYVDSPRLVASLEGIRVREVACGARHSLILASDGSVYAAGECRDGQTGIVLPFTETVPQTTGGEATADLITADEAICAQSWYKSASEHVDGRFIKGTCMWGPTRIPGLSAIGVFRVAAAGDHSLFVRVTHGSVLSTAPGSLPKRQLAAIDAPTVAAIGKIATESQNFAPVKTVIRDVLSHFTNCNASFLLQPDPMFFQLSATPPNKSDTTDSTASPFSDACTTQADALIRNASGAFGDISYAGRTILFATPTPGPVVPAELFVTSSGVDFFNLEVAYTALVGSYNPEVVAELAKSQVSLMDELEPVMTDLCEPDALRALLITFMSPINSRPAVSAAFVARLCHAILSLPQAMRDTLIQWIGKDVPATLFSTRFVRPLQAHISFHLKNIVGGRAAAIVAATKPAGSRPVVETPLSATGVGRSASSEHPEIGSKSVAISHMQAFEYVIRVMRLFNNLNDKLALEGESTLAVKPVQQNAGPTWFTQAAPSIAPITDIPVTALAYGALIPHEEFYNTDICALPDELLQLDYQRWARAGYQRTVSSPIILCGYPFLLDPPTKRRLLHFEALSEMQTEANNALARSFFTESPFLELHVRRDHVVEDTLNQLIPQPPNVLKKQLRVSFHGEEGIDAGGPRRELFQLLIRQVFDPASEYGLFTEIPDTPYSWFNPAFLPGSDREYFLVGLLLGLAIYNGVTLDLHFPPVVFKKLLGRPGTFLDLKIANPLLASSLEKVLEYDQDDLEDVMCLTWEATYESFGEAQTAELAPGGKGKLVTQKNKYEYVAAYVNWFLNLSIAASFREFLRGFVTVVNGASLILFRPDELEQLVCGTPSLDFKELEKVTLYDGGFSPSDATVKAFWSVVHSFTPEQKRKLLEFVTGCPKAPVGGLGKLPFKVQRAGPDTDHLPTASVCFHVLLLPSYSSEDKLRERLLKAIEECAGFGLK
jgi:alpha-tubulin suppressor-like RCC1 family protein